MALRAIVLNVFFRQADGETLTAQEMQGLIDRADSDKLNQARKRLAKPVETGAQPERKSCSFFVVPGSTKSRSQASVIKRVGGAGSLDRGRRSGRDPD